MMFSNDIKYAHEYDEIKLHKNWINMVIYQQEALEDLDVLENLLCNVYSGKKYCLSRGISFSDRINAIRKVIVEKSCISQRDFFELICNSIQDIRDFHMQFCLPNQAYKVFCKHRTAWFTDLKIEKKGENYVIIDTSYDDLPQGTIVIPKEENIFPTLNGMFLFGCLSDMDESKITLPCLERTITIPLKTVITKVPPESIWSSECINDIDIIEINRLILKNSHDEMDFSNLIEYGHKLRTSKKLIIDLRGNQGGYYEYIQKFIENLNDSAVFNLNYAKLNSQYSRLAEISYYATCYDEYKKEVDRVSKDRSSVWEYSEKKVIESTGFQGQLYVLVDRNTASSAEIFVKCLKDNIPQCKLVGENTKGQLNTGDVRYFYLQHSLIFLNIPTAVFENVFEEGTGYLPDYWVNEDAKYAALDFLSK